MSLPQGFAAFEEKVAAAKVGVNTDDDSSSLAFLRKAINAPDRFEVLDMIKQGVLDFRAPLQTIELKTLDTTKIIENGPRHYLFKDVLETTHAGLHVALIGPAGSGKSTMCHQVAEALDLKYFLQNAVTGTHELAGYMDAYGKYNGTSFRSAFEGGGFILVDEVDTSDPGALKWINTALANGHAMFPDKPEPVLKHKDFRIAIAANTFGNGADRVYVGANQLDASTLDRFVFFDFGYDEPMEKILSGNVKWAERVQQLRKAAAAEKARVVISPRASQHGARLLALGWKQDKVEDSVIWKGMDEELKKRIIQEAITPGHKNVANDNDKKKKKAA